MSTLSDILKHPSKHFTSDRKITKDTAFQNILSAGFQSLIYIDDDLILQPGPKNKKSCTPFFLRSKSGKPTTQAIYTANKKGEFSMGQIENCI